MVICCNVVKTTGMEGGLRVLGDAVGHAGEAFGDPFLEAGVERME